MTKILDELFPTNKQRNIKQISKEEFLHQDTIKRVHISDKDEALLVNVQHLKLNLFERTVLPLVNGLIWENKFKLVRWPECISCLDMLAKTRIQLFYEADFAEFKTFFENDKEISFNDINKNKNFRFLGKRIFNSVQTVNWNK